MSLVAWVPAGPGCPNFVLKIILLTLTRTAKRSGCDRRWRPTTTTRSSERLYLPKNRKLCMHINQFPISLNTKLRLFCCCYFPFVPRDAQLPLALRKPHSGTSSSVSYSPIPSSITSSSSDSPLCTPVTPSLFHSRLRLKPVSQIFRLPRSFTFSLRAAFTDYYNIQLYSP